MVKTDRVGLSLSGCVLDIAAGRVKLAEVGSVVSASDPDVGGGWEEILDIYCRTVWSDYPDAHNIATALLAQGKILTPRSRGLPMPNLTATSGFWITQST